MCTTSHSECCALLVECSCQESGFSALNVLITGSLLFLVAVHVLYIYIQEDGQSIGEYYGNRKANEQTDTVCLVDEEEFRLWIMTELVVAPDEREGH